MFRKILAFVVIAYLPTAAVLFVGCAEEDAYTPRIVGTVPELHHSGYASVNPTPYRSVSSSFTYRTDNYNSYRNSYRYYKPDNTSTSYGWIPSARERNWRAIVIHHSATDRGDISSIDDYHRNNNGWDGIGYDFVIGNGSGMGNGEVAATFRWTQQKTGAHCKTDESNWANESAIGICLIGNFDRSRPSSSQMASLMKLLRFLSERYDIPVSRIYGHNTTPGHSTKTSCPGRFFPMTYVKTHL